VKYELHIFGRQFFTLKRGGFSGAGNWLGVYLQLIGDGFLVAGIGGLRIGAGNWVWGGCGRIGWLKEGGWGRCWILAGSNFNSFGVQIEEIQIDYCLEPFLKQSSSFCYS